MVHGRYPYASRRRPEEESAIYIYRIDYRCPVFSRELSGLWFSFAFFLLSVSENSVLEVVWLVFPGLSVVSCVRSDSFKNCLFMRDLVFMSSVNEFSYS